MVAHNFSVEFYPNYGRFYLQELNKFIECKKYQQENCI